MFLYHAEPVPMEDLERPAETELTRAARNSISNANQITTAETEFGEADFSNSRQAQDEAKKAAVKRKKARKTERKRKTAARRRK
jgi:hypothetical protein